MIDIHCHLLPGIDDGPGSLEQALALAQASVDDGITHAVLTPHVFPGRFENRRSSIADEAQVFQAALASAGIPLSVSFAGEVRLTPEVLDLLAIDELPFLGTVNGQRTMLLEMPDGQVPLGAERFVRACLNARVRPVIAHPERNRALMERPERLRGFIDMGCYVQVTAGSLIGQFGSRAQDVARWFVAEEMAHVVASDAHNLGGRRPRMREAARWLETTHGRQVAHELTVAGPARLCGRAATQPH